MKKSTITGLLVIVGSIAVALAIALSPGKTPTATSDSKPVASSNSPANQKIELRRSSRWELGKKVDGVGLRKEGIPMVKWDPATAKYIKQDGDSKGWENTNWTSPRKYKIGFTVGTEASEFQHTVSNGIRAAVKKIGGAGVELIVLDNQFPSSTKPLENADILVNQGVDFVIDFNVNSSVQMAVQKKYQAAKIPVTIIDVNAPEGITTFAGGNKFLIGELMGQASIEWAKKHNWDMSKTAVVLSFLPDLGEITNQFLVSSRDKLLTAFPELPVDNVFEIKSDITYQTGLNNMAAWLQGHPNFEHYIAVGIDDGEMLGITKALDDAGHGGDSITWSAGANMGLKFMREHPNSAFKGSVAYYPLHYADNLIPQMLDILAGKSVPEEVHSLNKMITRDNIGDLQWPN